MCFKCVILLEKRSYYVTNPMNKRELPEIKLLLSRKMFVLHHFLVLYLGVVDQLSSGKYFDVHEIIYVITIFKIFIWGGISVGIHNLKFA